jgi:hypothetical protein
MPIEAPCVHALLGPCVVSHKPALTCPRRPAGARWPGRGVSRMLRRSQLVVGAREGLLGLGGQDDGPLHHHLPDLVGPLLSLLGVRHEEGHGGSRRLLLPQMLSHMLHEQHAFVQSAQRVP